MNPSGAKLVASAMLKSRGGSDRAVQELQAAKTSPQAILVASSPATAAFVEAYRMEGGTAQVYARPRPISSSWPSVFLWST